MAADKRASRLGVLAVVAGLLFGAIGVRLWFLQTVQSESLQATVDAAKQVTVNIPPERGRIFDADGRILADNRGTHTVSVDWAAIRSSTNRAALFTRLSGWLEMTVNEMEARYDSGRYSRYTPMPLKEDVSEEVAIALQERIEDFPGVSVVDAWQRVYPYAPIASHVIGYLGAIGPEDEERYRELGYDTSRDGERVGASGVEQSYETQLHGQWGQRTYEIDAANRIVRTLSYTPPVNGQDIQLSIDLDYQWYAERLLVTQLQARRQFTAANPAVTRPDGTRGPLDPNLAVGTRVHYKAPAGSIVAMDQNTGAVLAMASYPTYDNRWFAAGVDQEKFEELFPADVPDDEARLINRAIQGRYNMGSTFKLYTAYAALSIGMLTPTEAYYDQGTYQLQSISPERCAQNGVRCVFRNSTCGGTGQPCVYGSVNVTQALAVSSDTFFYHLGEEMYLTPGTPFQDMVRQIGLGADTGIDLPNAFDSQIATNELQAELADAGVLGEGASRTLQPGDLLQMSIGQGITAITPLHLAVGYAAVGNGGNVVVPHVAHAILAPETPDADQPGFADLSRATVVEYITPPPREAPMPPGVRDPIVAGLRQNITGPGVNSRSTTAEELFDVGYPADAIQIAGKTGTAQGAGNYPWNDSSAFAAFSIDPDPARQITVASYLQRAGYGSVGAAPVVKCMYLAYSGMITLDTPPIADPLDLDDTVAAHDPPRVDRSCMQSSIAGTLAPLD